MNSYYFKFIFAGIIVSVSLYAADLRTLQGKSYEDVTIIKIDKDKLTIQHKKGIANIEIEEIPEEFIKANPDIKEKIDEIIGKENLVKKQKEEEDRLRKEEEENEILKAKLEAELRGKENKAILDDLFAKQEKIATPNLISNAVVLLEGSNGAGTGFKAMLGKLPVIFTNAHVFLGLKDVVIKDLDNNTYEIEQVFTSKTRDLVILKYEINNPKDPNILNICSAANKIPLDSQVTAYGNTLGDGVITTIKGHLLGIGPEKIEINAQILPGNSGGPIINSTTKEVIGISTYLRFIKPLGAVAEGSRFGSINFSSVVRRFAIRLDNIERDDIQILSVEEIKKDQKQFWGISDLQKKIDLEIDKLSNTDYTASKIRIFNELKDICLKNYHIIKDFEQQSIKTLYLKKHITESFNHIDTIFSILNIKSEILEKEILDAFEKMNIRKKTITTSAEYQKCSQCRGRGNMMERNPSYNGKQLDSKTFVAVTCHACNGTGRIKISNEKSSALIDIDISKQNELTQLIKIEKNDFTGFTMGKAFYPDCPSIQYYNDKLISKKKDNGLEIIKYKGNHLCKSATSTTVVLLFGRLVKIEVNSPRNTHETKQLIQIANEEKKKGYSFSNISFYEVGDTSTLKCVHEIYAPYGELLKRM